MNQYHFSMKNGMPYMFNSKKLLFNLSLTYLLILAICTLVIFFLPTFEEVGHLDVGCYLRDAMLPYVDCVGFPGSRLAYYIVNLPLFLIFLPVAGVLTFLRAPWLILVALLIWSPIVYLVWYGLSLQKVRSSVD